MCFFIVQWCLNCIIVSYIVIYKRWDIFFADILCIEPISSIVVLLSVLSPWCRRISDSKQVKNQCLAIMELGSAWLVDEDKCESGRTLRTCKCTVARAWGTGAMYPQSGGDTNKLSVLEILVYRSLEPIILLIPSSHYRVV